MFNSLFSNGGSTRNRAVSGNKQTESKGSGASARALARQQLADDIGAFLIANDLEISEANLSAALGICAGSNPALARKYPDLRAADQPVPQTRKSVVSGKRVSARVHLRGRRTLKQKTHT